MSQHEKKFSASNVPDTSVSTSKSEVTQTAVKYEYSPDFPGILKHLGASLALSTYQAGKVAVIGVQDDALQFSFHNLEQAMGIAVGPDAIALGSRREIHLLRAAHDIAPGITPAGTHDAAWLTRHSFRTGDIHGHELAWGRDGLWAVNTRFSCLCTLQESYSFVPRWRPPFITALEPGDRCHLNGLAMLDGRPKFVTAHGDSNEPGGWRATKATGGVVIDVESGATVARGFAMPHSPRLSHGRLWTLNSGAGQLGTIDVDSGRYESVATFPGFTRGLAFHGQFAFVGLSKIRETSVFGGMPLEEHRSELRCGVGVVDLTSGRTVATLQFHSGVDELFAVSVLPDCLRPCVVGPHDVENERADIWVVPAIAAAPGQSTSLPSAVPPADATSPAEQLSRLVALADEFQREGRVQEAIQAYQKAIALEPRRASLHCNVGNLWQQLADRQQQQQAIECYELALECDPQCIPAMQNLGFLFGSQGRTAEAVQQYEQLLENDASPLNRLLAASVLPVVYDSVEEIDVWRNRLTDRLDELIAGQATIDTTDSLVPTSFFIAYQGRNDVEVMRRLGSICQGPELTRPAAGVLKRRSDGRLRIGFLSAYFRDHTIGRLNLGCIQQLDRSRFEVTVLSASRSHDSVAESFRAAADRYRTLPQNVTQARRVVADQDLDILIFADVGMDSLTTTLARSRMAPLQCATWGHPETTGSAQIDYFLSSELLETSDADDHYTERLVRLPLLGTYFERPTLSQGPSPLVPRPSTHTYVCPQTLFKFHPDFDAVIAGILVADPQAQIILLEGRDQHWTDQLKRRFGRTLPESGKRVRFLPAMPREQFLRLLATADVVLDPLHFGGGHSSYEALSVGAPVVTLPGEFLRNRITQALYRKMGFTELIVGDATQFIETAVRLGTDPSARENTSRRILETCPVLFEDLAEVAGLEDWLWSRGELHGVDRPDTVTNGTF
ncbi:MAG: TIGR03032 family protein [Planctomycetota bacterium]|nr:TIGR03032 family protein [Planctomycetota bacterium]